MKQFFIKNRINIVFIFLFFYFYYYPIISLNLKYRDDYVRSLYLIFGFTQEGRLVSKFLLNFFTYTDGVLIAPLTQLVSIACIACTIAYTATIIFKKLDFFSFSIVSLIFLNPFYLQNMSFGYDSLPMTISTCCAVISATLILQKRYYLITTVFLICIILLSYQATLGLYINCLLFILCKHYLKNGWDNQSKIYTRTIICISINVILCLAYLYISPYLFNGLHNRIIIELSNIKTNLLHTIFYIKLLFLNIHYIIYITAFITLFSLIIFHFKRFKDKKNTLQHIFTSLIVIPLIYITTLFAAEGPSVILNFEIDNLRVLIGISLLWVLSFYFISLFSKSLYYVFYFVFSVFCFSTSYSYGIFLKDQDLFFQSLMNNINYDIGHTSHSPELKIFSLNPLPLSDSNKRLTAKVPFFLYLYGEQDFDWLTDMKISNILPYYPSSNLTEICQSIHDLHSNKKSLIKTIQSDRYTLYFDKDNVLIDFYTERKSNFCKGQ